MRHRHGLWPALYTLIIMAWTVLSGRPLCAQSVLSLDELARNQSLYPNWEQFTQTQVHDDIHTIKTMPDQSWERRSNPILPLHKGPHWARLSFDHGGSQVQTLVLEDEWVPTNHLDVFLVQDGRILSHHEAGDHRPAAVHSSANRYPVFHLQIPPGRSTLFLRYESDDIPGVRAVLWTPSAFEVHRMNETLLLGSTLGILVVMALYNLIIYFFVRIRAYLYYSAYVASFLIFEFCIQGLGSLFIWHSTWTNGEAVLIAAMLALIFALQFTDHFLNMARHIPGIRRYLRWLQGLCVANILLTCIHLQAGNIFGVLVNLLAVAWILTGTLKLVAQKHTTAYVMLSAWGFFLVGNSWTIFNFIGLVPAGYGGRWAMLLGADFEVIALSLGLAQHMARLRREKLNAELSEAKVLSNIEAAMRFQESLLGSVQPSPCLRFSSFFQPAERIGGDWYDYAMLGRGRYAFIFVGDVTGHGLPATLLSSAVSGCIRSTLYGLASQEAFDPRDILLQVAQRANTLIWNSGSQQGSLMSMIMLCLDLSAMEVFHLNAGHPHPILRSNDQRYLLSRGSLLGVSLEPEFEVRRAALQKGDTLILYTDGVMECQTKGDNLLSQRALARLIAEHPHAAQTVAALQELFTKTPGVLTDDITVLCVDIGERWHPATDLQDVAA